MDSEQIRTIRNQLAMSQQAFAAALGVSFATVNRWENGKAKPQKDRIDRIKALLHGESAEVEVPLYLPVMPVRLDFEGDADAVKLVVDAHRLQNGHLFNKAFGLELSRVVPLRIEGVKLLLEALLRRFPRVDRAPDHTILSRPSRHVGGSPRGAISCHWKPPQPN